MAIVTHVSESYQSGALLRSEWIYDDSNAIIDEDGAEDIGPCDLISVSAEAVGGTFLIEVRRRSGQVWRSDTIAPTDGVLTYNAGGPVRTVDALLDYSVTRVA